MSIYVESMDKDSQDVHQELVKFKTRIQEAREQIGAMPGIDMSLSEQQHELETLREQVRTKNQLLQKYKSLCMFEVPKASWGIFDSTKETNWIQETLGEEHTCTENYIFLYLEDWENDHPFDIVRNDLVYMDYFWGFHLLAPCSHLPFKSNNSCSITWTHPVCQNHQSTFYFTITLPSGIILYCKLSHFYFVKNVLSILN